MEDHSIIESIFELKKKLLFLLCLLLNRRGKNYKRIILLVIVHNNIPITVIRNFTLYHVSIK